MKMIKRLNKMLITLIFILLPFVFTSCEVEDIEQEAIAYTTNIGLHVENDGTIIKENKVYYGIGLNYFGAFAHSFNDDEYNYKEAFESISSYDIPFVRLPLCGYFMEYYEEYDKDPELMISKMKAILDCAEENNVGVIVNLLWWDPAVSLHVNEKRADMGNVNSKTIQYAKQYVNRIVSEFLNHEAVWAWEIGNEYNLSADLFDENYQDYLYYNATNVNEFDYYTTIEMNTFFEEIAKEIRTIDNYRLISTGHGELRDSSYSMYKVASNNKDHKWEVDWSKNKKGQFNKMIGITTSDSIDTVSLHLQIDSGDLMVNRYRKSLTLKEYLAEYVNASKKQNKALYFGEFGDFNDNVNFDIKIFNEVLEAIKETKIQISSSWQFQDYTNEGINQEKLEALKKANKELNK